MRATIAAILGFLLALLAGCDEPAGRAPIPQAADHEPDPEPEPEPDPEQPDDASTGEPDPEPLLDLGAGEEWGETETGEPEPEPVPGLPCVAHEDCTALSSACGVGKCGMLGCEVQLYAEGLECEPDDLCMVSGSCSAGVCIGAAAVDCSSLDGPCGAGVCDANTGECEVSATDC